MAIVVVYWRIAVVSIKGWSRSLAGVGAGPVKNGVCKVCGEIKMLNQSAGAIAPVVSAIQSPVMTSREIADLTGKQHAHVMRDIRAYMGAILQMERGVDVKSLDWASLEGVSGFGETPIGGVVCSEEINQQNGQPYPVYILDKSATLTIISGYNILLRKKIIDRWQELENRQPAKIPQTFAEALRLAAEMEEEKERLQLQLTEAAPKVAFVDRYVTATGSMTFRQVAKLLEAKEPELRLFLIESRVMYRLNGVLTPYSQHIEAGRFEVRTGTTSDSNYAFSQSRFTAKGVQWIGGLWTAHKAAGGAE